MSQSEAKCLCCNRNCMTSRRPQHVYSIYECDECGTYAIPDNMKPISLSRLSAMYFYLIHKRHDDEKIVFFVRDSTMYNDAAAHYIDVNMLEALSPKSLNDRIDMILLNLSTRIKTLGDQLVLPYPRGTDPYYTFFWVDDTFTNKGFERQIVSTIKIMQDYGYIEGGLSLGDNKTSYTFTAQGWNRVGDLQKKNSIIPQAFIAMWFAEEMKNARDSIIRAVVDSGYVPLIIDDKEHNNQIVPEIFYEIRRSTFVIADLTGHRNGVYYEAGYAQALEKEVILACRSDDFEKKHFDVAQKCMIQWNDENDLYLRLKRRIEATVGKRTILN